MNKCVLLILYLLLACPWICQMIPLPIVKRSGNLSLSDNICVASPVGRAEKDKTATGIFLRMHNSLLTLNELCVPRVLEIL